MIINPSVLKAAESRRPDETRPAGAPAPAALNAAPAPLAVMLPPATAPDAAAQAAALSRRVANLAFGGARPSPTEMERLIGLNDLVDEFYLQRALVAAQPVMRLTLRDAAGSEFGWATGFMVSPRLLLTNWHVFPTQADAANAIAEADYVLDISGNPAPSVRFLVRADQFYLADQDLDFAIVAVSSLAQDGVTPLSRYGYHRLVDEPHKIHEGEAITLIQHPGGARRQFSIRENNLIKTLDNFLWYRCDTAPGSSGAPAFNDSFQVVALHHSGAAQRDEDGRYVLKDGAKVDALDGYDESQICWVANEGLRVSVLCAFLRARLDAGDSLAAGLLQAMQGGDVIETALSGAGAPSPTLAASGGTLAGGSISVPLQLHISLSAGGVAGVAVGAGQGAAGGAGALPPGVEAMRYPYVDRDYTARRGYQNDFLGVAAPLPVVTDPDAVAQLADGSRLLPYEHFSVAVHKQRRLPLFTAANLDYSPASRRPEPGDYSRRGLTGLGKNDQEKWFTDPRIPQQHQLPDVFYTRDGGYFDKGHVVRREDVCWGESYAQVRRANGDTFHVTNCTPQMGDFNRAAIGANNWGDLEDELQRQAKTERLSVFAGPVLAADDPFFEGRDDFGAVRIQIPRAYWKVALANEKGKLAAYAFILEQDLAGMPAEFAVTAAWKPYLVTLKKLEARLVGLKFPAAFHAADRARRSAGRKVAQAIGVEIYPGPDGER